MMPPTNRTISADDIVRCEREIEEILNLPSVIDGTAPAWLVVLGVEDWLAEMKILRPDVTFPDRNASNGGDK